MISPAHAYRSAVPQSAVCNALRALAVSLEYWPTQCRFSESQNHLDHPLLLTNSIKCEKTIDEVIKIRLIDQSKIDEGKAFQQLALSGAILRKRYYETWGCGRAVQSANLEYTAAAFANPFKRVFAFLYRPVTTTEIGHDGGSRLFVKTIRYRQESRSIIEEGIYEPLTAAIRRTSARVRAVQSGNVHSYLLYMLLALAVLLLVAK